jgi:hypothetical protein
MRLQLATTCHWQLLCLEARRLERIELLMLDALVHAVLPATST